MRRSHPSSIDPKGLAGISFDVCSIASTETASTVVGRGRGAGGLRKRRGGGVAESDECCSSSVDKGVMSLYSDPFSSMFSPTSSLGGGGVMGGFMGQRKAIRQRTQMTSSSSTVSSLGSSAMMCPPDARRSHSALIGSKQNSHLRSSVGAGNVQSVRVEISPTGSPSSPLPPAITSGIAPTMNAFRRCLLLNNSNSNNNNKGISGSIPTSTSHPLFSVATEQDPQLLVGGEVGEIVSYTSSHTTGPFSLNHCNDGNVGGVRPSACCDDDDSDEVIEEIITEEEHHIYLFDDDDDDVPSSSYHRSAGRRDQQNNNNYNHCGGKERRTALTRRQNALLPSSSASAGAPYAKSNNPHRRLGNDNTVPGVGDGCGSMLGGNAFALARNMRRRRRVCRSRYDIEESDEDEGGGEGKGSAIYYVQVSHSALTPRDAPDDLPFVPQMPLLPSSEATAVVDKELAVLEELML